MSDNKCAMIEIFPIAFLKWNNLLKQELVEVEPPDPHSSFNRNYLPGTKNYQLRPYLRTSASPGGVASLFVRGDGETMPVAVLSGDTPRVMPLQEPPISLVARSDGGLWALFDSSLVDYDANGTKKQVLNVSGMDLLGVEGDAVWVMGSRQVWFVSASGEIRGPFSWEGDDGAGYGKLLCRLDYNQPGGFPCIQPDGETRFISKSWFQDVRGVPLVFTDSKVLRTDLTGSELFYYSAEGVSAQLSLDNAGITSEGEAFVSINLDNNWTQLCISNGTKMLLPVKYENPSFQVPSEPIVIVVAVEGNRTLAFNFDRAIWYEGERISHSFVVDDERYSQDVFPHAWQMNPVRSAHAKSDGTVILSSTGPSGVAIIGLRWTP